MVMPTTLEAMAEALRAGGVWHIDGMGTKEALGVASSVVRPSSLGSDVSFGREPSGNPPPGASGRSGGGQGGGPSESGALRPSSFGGEQEGPLGSGEKPKVLSTLALTGIVDWSPDDQVVVVRAGTPISLLQAELYDKGQCIPLADPDDAGELPAGVPGTVGGMVAMNLPHALQAQCGGVRDWVLGLTLVRPDGSIAKCGSRVVKNVAGYDVQKLMIGSRGTLAVIGEVVLRTFPLRALPAPTLTGQGEIDLEHAWIQRTLRADFIGARAAAFRRSHWADEASSTLWAHVEPGETPPRFVEDWVLAPGRVPLPEGPIRAWMLRAKQVFDPDARLNPGAMGAW